MEKKGAYLGTGYAMDMGIISPEPDVQKREGQ